MTLAVTQHAIARYRERVKDMPDEIIRAALSGRAFDAAETVGRCSVILPSGHRAIIRNGTIITILPLGGHAFHGRYRERENA